MNLEERNNGYAAEIEHFFRTRLVDRYDDRAAELWQRDTSSVEAYLDSVAERRQAWHDLLAPPSLTVHETHTRDWDVPDSTWIHLELDDGLTARGALVVPEGATKLVVFAHGLGSTPEKVFGLADPRDVYDHIGPRLVEAGYAVLAPMNLYVPRIRNRAQSLCRLAGTTMEGLEYARFQALLDTVGELAPGLDLDAYALAGLSWGGLAAQYWGALDERAVAVATCGFYNHRPNKMVVEDPRWSSFYVTDGHHAYLHGMLSEGFGDADLASLVCPRPFLVQHGRADLIGWWMDVRDEFERAKEHWSALGLGERAEFHLHEAGHVVDGPQLIEWLARVY